MEKISLSDLCMTVKTELLRLGYSPLTVKAHQRVWNHYIRYLSESDDTGEADLLFYSEETSIVFLKVKYDFPREKTNGYDYAYARSCNAARSMSLLGDFQLFGCFLHRKKNRHRPEEHTSYYQNIMDAYRERGIAQGHAENTIRLRERHFELLLKFLEDRRIDHLNELTPQNITTYVQTLNVGNTSYTVHRIGSLRHFLRFAYLNAYMQKDLSHNVPRLKRRNVYAKLPSAWTQDEMNRVLAQVDRGNPGGKRDYAMLLLTIRLGMRISDLTRLKMEHLDWASSTISFIQQKTQQRIILPILPDVGWALIDYLKYGRHDTTSKYVFIHNVAPYVEFQKPSGVGGVLARYVRKAGIPAEKAKRGFHSFRHSLARELLEQDTPLQQIQDILGHVSIDSATPYLRIDVEGLRQCAFELKAGGNFE